MTVPSVAASSADSTGNTNGELTISNPSGTILGSLLVLLATQYNAGADPVFGTITDWTKEVECIETSGSDRSGSALYWRYADGVATNVTTVTSPNNNAFGLCGKVLRIADAHASAPMHKKQASTGAAISAGSPFTLVGLTTTVADCLILGLVGTSGASTLTATWSAGITEQGDFGTDPGGASSLTWATATQASAGAFANKTVTPSGSGHGSGVMVAIQGPPAPSATEAQRRAVMGVGMGRSPLSGLWVPQGRRSRAGLLLPEAA